MYTANLIAKTREGTAIRVSVEFIQGQDIIRQDFLIDSAEGLEKELRRRIQLFGERDSLFDSILVGEIQLPIEETPVLTQDQIKEAEYSVKVRDLQDAKRELDLGVIDQDEYDTALNQVKTLKQELKK